MNNIAPFQVDWSGKGLQYTDEEIALVGEVMRSADPLTQGRYQAEFERTFSNYVGSRHAFAVSSATAALELSALLCRLGPGDEVIIPAHTFAASAISFARTGAKIVWADIDRDTRVVTAATIEPCITSRTRCVVVVHLYGLVCDMDPILALADQYNFKVVEDAAQAVGSRYKGRQAGSIGDFGCFSFHTHKNISTLGEGGMLTVKSDADAALTPGLRHNGMRGFPEERQHYWIPAMGNVDFDIDGLWPYNFCLGEIQCALGTRLLGRLDVVNADRGQRAARFIAAMKDYPELVFQSVPKGCEHSWHLLAARYDGQKYGKTRDDLIALLAYTYGVKCAVQYYPLYRYPMFRKAGLGEANCPETDHFFDNMISFPFHHWMPEDQFTYMLESLRTATGRLQTGS
ncbi:MAG: DegT/DnrJ/EryC1/StrS family aminotransferase [Pseudomonadota bacterium]